MLCRTTTTQKLFCLHVFRQAVPPQRVDCLAPRWETALSVFPKDTATRYRIGSRIKVSQPFDYLPGALPTESRRHLFETDYDEIGLYKISYDVISGTSLLLCHRKTLQDFSILVPLP